MIDKEIATLQAQVKTLFASQSEIRAEVKELRDIYTMIYNISADVSEVALLTEQNSREIKKIETAVETTNRKILDHEIESRDRKIRSSDFIKEAAVSWIIVFLLGALASYFIGTKGGF